MSTLEEALGVEPRDRLAVIGSGGKSTLLFRLASEAAGDVLLTTTTKMGPTAPVPILEFASVEDFAARWRRLEAPRRALAARRGEGKLHGLTPEEVDALADLEGLDLLVVEADGSRQMPAKAHAPYEPVLFGSCTLGVAVLGLSALGRPIAPGQVHRPELLAPLLGLRPNDVLDVDALARLLNHYLDKLPARRVACLTQVAHPEAARTLAAQVRARVVVLHRAGQEVLCE